MSISTFLRVTIVFAHFRQDLILQQATDFEMTGNNSCVLMVPLRYTKFSVCSNSCPSTSRRNFLFSSSKNWHSLFCMFICMPIFWLTCATPVSVFCNLFSCSVSKAPHWLHSKHF